MTERHSGSEGSSGSTERYVGGQELLSSDKEEDEDKNRSKPEAPSEENLTNSSPQGKKGTALFRSSRRTSVQRNEEDKQRKKQEKKEQKKKEQQEKKKKERELKERFKENRKEHKRKMASIPVIVGNRAERYSEGYYKWTMYVRNKGSRKDEDLASFIKDVTYHLHPTFFPSKVTVSEPPYELERKGWGVFEVGVVIALRNGNVFKLKHLLSFSTDEFPNENVHRLPVD